MVDKLGADKCLNYKSPSFQDNLAKGTDGFVDISFDNVGVSIFLSTIPDDHLETHYILMVVG